MSDVGVTFRPFRKLFMRVCRARAARLMESEGFGLIGGEPSPLPASRVAELLSHVEDDDVYTQAMAVGAIGDGAFLQALQNLVDWVISHQDQIMKIVQIIMTIAALFV